MKIGLLGFGVVGVGIFEMSATHEQMQISRVLCLAPESVPDGKGTGDAQDILNDDSVDTVVEAMGGLHPAYELVSAALKKGKNVVTANKYLMCAYYRELLTLASENGVALRFTAAVGGGIPWLVNLERARRNDTITRVGGILNGTTNYILDTMHHSPVPFGEVLASAQRLGYAEADPSADIDGNDICRKLALSANIAFDAYVQESQVDTFGIRRVTAADIACFAAHGYTCKLLASAGKNADGSLYAYVEPSLLGPDWPEATVPSNYNLVSMEGVFIGKESFFGQGAGRYPTAYNVVEDLLDIQNGTTNSYVQKAEPVTPENGEVLHRYYLRTQASHTLAVEQNWENGVILAPVCVRDMHAAARKMAQKDETTFFASVL